MFLSALGILDALAGIIGLYAIYFGGLKDLAYTLLVVVMLKGVWSIISGLQG